MKAVASTLAKARGHNTSPPHSRCNFLTDDGLLIAGAGPVEFTLDSILEWQPSLIVSLEKTDDALWYQPKLPKQTKVLHLPTAPGRPPPLAATRSAVSEIIDTYRSGKKVYLHCNGGHGRAGTLAAVVLGKLNSWDAVTAIAEVERRRDTRLDTSRNFVPTPETKSQVAFVAKILGVGEGRTLPDRTDRSWLKRMVAERTKGTCSKHMKTETDVGDTSLEILRTDKPSGTSMASEDLTPILFYTDSAQFGEFSNYYKPASPITWEGAKYPTSEHAFQAAKFKYPGADKHSLAYAEEIRKASTPNKARVLALQKTGGGYAWRTQLNPVIQEYLDKGVRFRPSWETVRDDVMRDILGCKFTQDAHCRALLVGTGQRPIVEHTKRDSYWGDGGDGTGQNKLGKMLMEVRDALKS